MNALRFVSGVPSVLNAGGCQVSVAELPAIDNATACMLMVPPPPVCMYTTFNVPGASARYLTVTTRLKLDALVNVVVYDGAPGSVTVTRPDAFQPPM